MSKTEASGQYQSDADPTNLGETPSLVEIRMLFGEAADRGRADSFFPPGFILTFGRLNRGSDEAKHSFASELPQIADEAFARDLLCQYSRWASSSRALFLELELRDVYPTFLDFDTKKL